MSSDTLTCREPNCGRQFAAATDELAAKFRARHEEVVHAARYLLATQSPYAIRTDPPAYVRTSVTSLSASQAIRAETATLRERVFEYLRKNGPATDQQMQDALGMDPSTQRPRRRELEKERRVRDSGRTAKTKANRSAVLWEAVR